MIVSFARAFNVKVGPFVLTFLPQYLPATGSTLPGALGLSAIFAAIYVAWFSGIVVLVGLVSGSVTSAARENLDRARHRQRARRLRDPTDCGDRTLTRFDLDTERTVQKEDAHG